MADKHTEELARKQLPDPTTYDENYIDIHVPRNSERYEVVTFAKQDKDGSKIWIPLPYAR